jgi:uncharacterized membrane protein YqjE
MTPKRSLAITALALLAGVVAILVLPATSLDAAIVFGLPPLVVLAILAEIYLAKIYRDQPIPRSRFFRMLVAAQSGKIALGLWVGYLVVARAGDRTGWFSIPSPSMDVSGPISGLLVGVVVAIPISYALEIWRVRRAASRTPTTAAEDEIDLDREPNGGPA